MKTIGVLLVLVSFQYVRLLKTKNNIGTDFYFGMIPSYSSYYPEDIDIDIASENRGSLNLQVPYLGINRTETLIKGSNALKVSGTLIRKGTFTGNRGIYIKTNVPVAVYVTYKVQNVMDTFMAFPLSSLGTDYMVASYAPSWGDRSELMVIGVTNNTLVRLTYRNNTESLKTLDNLDVYQIAENSDLSGIKISANKRISVISGASCSFIPDVISYACDFLVSQMVPYEFWTNSFIVPHLEPNRESILRAMWLDPTSYCIKTDTYSFCNQTISSSDVTYPTKDSSAVITSDSSLSVAQYNVGDLDGDPFIMSIPGINNYMNRYNFVISTAYSSANNSICITIPTSKAHGLLLDGLPFTATRNDSVPDPFSNYTLLYTTVNVGYHELAHNDSSVTFGALAYGLGDQVGYGFPLGFGFHGAGSSMTDHTTTSSYTTNAWSSMTYQTTAPLPYTPNAMTDQTTVPLPYATNDGSVVCYDCEEMFHVELCETVKMCSKGEVCFLEHYMKHGRKVFRSGCLSQEVCPNNNVSNVHDPNSCTECCSESYCNHKGCGEAGLPARDLRGPLCYNCGYVYSPDECDTLSLCRDDQVCMIEEIEWGTRSEYSMGCAHASCSPAKRSVNSLMSRSTSVLCKSCCSADFCNQNCTTASGGNGQPVFVG